MANFKIIFFGVVACFATIIFGQLAFLFGILAIGLGASIPDYKYGTDTFSLIPLVIAVSIVLLILFSPLLFGGEKRISIAEACQGDGNSFYYDRTSEQRCWDACRSRDLVFESIECSNERLVCVCVNQ